MRGCDYEIKLSKREENILNKYLKRGDSKARKLTRCRILLMSHQGYEQSEISETLSITRVTVRKTCHRYLEEGLESAISEKPRSGAPSIFEGKQLAQITALACTEAPDGRSQWSLRLLADKAVELCIVDDISHSQVGRVLKKTK